MAPSVLTHSHDGWPQDSAWLKITGCVVEGNQNQTQYRSCEDRHASATSSASLLVVAAGVVWCGWVCPCGVGVCIDHGVVGYLRGVAICVGPQWHQQLPGGLAARQRRRLSHRPVLHLCQPNDGYLTVGQTLTPRCLNLTYTGNWTGSTFSDPLTFGDPGKFTAIHPEDITIAGGEATILTANSAQLQPIYYNLLNRNFQARFLQRPGSGQSSLGIWKDGNNHAFIV